MYVEGSNNIIRRVRWIKSCNLSVYQIELSSAESVNRTHNIILMENDVVCSLDVVVYFLLFNNVNNFEVYIYIRNINHACAIIIKSWRIKCVVNRDKNLLELFKKQRKINRCVFQQTVVIHIYLRAVVVQVISTRSRLLAINIFSPEHFGKKRQIT